MSGVSSSAGGLRSVNSGYSWSEGVRTPPRSSSRSRGWRVGVGGGLGSGGGGSADGGGSSGRGCDPLPRACSFQSSRATATSEEDLEGGGDDEMSSCRSSISTGYESSVRGFHGARAAEEAAVVAVVARGRAGMGGVGRGGEGGVNGEHPGSANMPPPSPAGDLYEELEVKNKPKKEKKKKINCFVLSWF